MRRSARNSFWRSAGGEKRDKSIVEQKRGGEERRPGGGVRGKVKAGSEVFNLIFRSTRAIF